MTTGDYDDLEELLHADDDREARARVWTNKKLKSRKGPLMRRLNTRRQLNASWRRELHAYNASHARDK